MKKLLSLLIFVLVLTCAFSVFADYKTVDIYVNGDLLVSDSPAVLVGSRTMVPLRAISEKLGCDVGWNADTQTAEIKNDKTAVYVTIDSDVMVKKTLAEDKSEDIKIDAPAMLYKSRTLIPLRAVSEALDAKVDWDSEKECALITTENNDTYFGKVTENEYVSEKLGINFKAAEGMVLQKEEENVKIKEVAETVEEVDEFYISEFSAYFPATGSNVIMAVSPATEVTTKDYLEYIRPSIEGGAGGIEYISAQGTGFETIAGYEFEKITFRGKYSDVMLNLEYCAGKVDGRLVFVVLSYADGRESDKHELIKAFSGIEK
jgi:hypothetical protein